jgi:hypothetical protein
VQAADFLIKGRQNFTAAESRVVNDNVDSLLDGNEALFLSTRERADR